MPLISNCMHKKIAGSKVFSTLDMIGAFLFIEIDKQDREKPSRRRLDYINKSGSALASRTGRPPTAGSSRRS